jgi:hypothetical protein
MDTLTDKIIATSPVGPQPQAFVYVPEVVRKGDETTNLIPL